MFRLFVALFGCAVLAACGGGGGGGSSTPAQTTPPPPPPPPAQYTVGGTVTGLAGTGLELRINGANPLAVATSGAFTFSGTQAAGSTFAVTVGTQPTSLSQNCVVTAGSGTLSGNVTSVQVTCTTSSFSVGGTVDGLFGQNLVLENNGGDALTVNANGPTAFATNVASGGAYDVKVRTQPTGTPAQTCTVSSGTGSVTNGAVTSVSVSCRAPTGRFLYVPAARTGSIAAFAIDADTGMLTPIPLTLPNTVTAPMAVFAHPSGRFVMLFGDEAPLGTGPTQVSFLKVDGTTGTLTVGFSSAAADTFLIPPVFHPNGKRIYVSLVSGTANFVQGYAYDELTNSFSLAPGSNYLANGQPLRPPVISPAGNFLYLASSVPATQTTPPQGTITKFTVDPTTGALTASGTTALPNNMANELIMHPAGTHLYTRNAVSPAFTQRFTINAADGALTDPPLTIDTTFGSGAIIAPGSNVYFPQLGGNFGAPAPGSIAGYVDVASGGIGALPGSPYSTGGNNATAAVLDPTGRFIVINNIASNTLAMMKIDPVQRGLAHAPGSPFAPAVGTQLGVVTFDPSGRFAYVSDAATQSVSSYAIDATTGALTFKDSEALNAAVGLRLAVVGLQ